MGGFSGGWGEQSEGSPSLPWAMLGALGAAACVYWLTREATVFSIMTAVLL